MGNRTRLKVAVAQIETVLGDLDAGFRKHLDVIERARRQGVEVLLFPELSLTGHGSGPEVLKLALRRDDSRILDLARASGEMVTVFGLVEEAIAAQFHNTAIAVQNGELVFLHRKINLATYGELEEGKHFATGRYVETFELGDVWRASILICADLWNPALVNLVAVHGATLLMTPISSAIEAVGVEFDNPGGWDICLRFYGMIYGFPVLMANRVGQEGNLNFWGGSRIIDPFGRTVAEAKGRTEQLVVAELDYGTLRRARYLLPTVRDSNLGLVLRETERLYQIIGVPEAVRKS
jgi:predicted amidohydrolase